MKHISFIKLVFCTSLLFTCIGCASFALNVATNNGCVLCSGNEKKEYLIATRTVPNAFRECNNAFPRLFMIVDYPFSVVSDLILVPFIAGYNFFELYKEKPLPPKVKTYTCDESIEASTPASRFTDNSNGTVTDNHTGLMWKKCPERQYGEDCGRGSMAKLSWSDAKSVSMNANDGKGFADYTDWRLPTIKELESIVEKRCLCPSINLSVFPNTPPNDFWSSSPVLKKDLYWFISFYNGKSGNNYGSANFRLVRTAH